MNQAFNRQMRQATASLYLIIGLALALLATQVYLSGYYQAILLPALLTPVFLGLGLLRWQTSAQLKYDPAAITALVSLAGLLLLQPETLSDFTQWHFVGLFYPLLAFYLLPNLASLAFSLLLLAGLLHLRLQHLPLENNLLFIAHYLLLMALSWIYGIRSRSRTLRLEGLVGQDGVTGFFNARHLQDCIDAEVSRARTTQKPLALLLVELHQFPELQQELGHSAANHFIREAAHICRLNCRGGDEAYRYDSQTLLLLLPNTTINGALVLRARLYQHLLRELVCDTGPLDSSITPLVLQPGESASQFWQRIGNSCYHSLSERVADSLQPPTSAP
jgi:diguanylate cyclase (GGDEF)-like protein